MCKVLCLTVSSHNVIVYMFCCILSPILTVYQLTLSGNGVIGYQGAVAKPESRVPRDQVKGM